MLRRGRGGSENLTPGRGELQNPSVHLEATGMQKGFARPGYFFIDRKGIIREKFFDARYLG